MAGRAREIAETSSPDWVPLQHGSLHAVVDAIADIHIKPPWLTEQGFVLRRTAAVTVTSGIVLGIGLGFNDHAPEQAAVVLAFHQPAAHQIGADNFCRAAEEGLR